MKNHKQNIILMSLLNENKTIDFLKKVSGASNFLNAKNNLKNIKNIQRVSSDIEYIKNVIDSNKHYADKHKKLSSAATDPDLKDAFLMRSKAYDNERKKAENVLDKYTRRVNKIIKNKSGNIDQISDLKRDIKKDIAIGGLKSAAILAATGYGIKKILDWRKKKKKEENIIQLI